MKNQLILMIHYLVRISRTGSYDLKYICVITCLVKNNLRWIYENTVSMVVSCDKKYIYPFYDPVAFIHCTFTETSTNQNTHKIFSPRYFGVNDPVAAKLMKIASSMPALDPPEDKSITTLYIGNVPACVTDKELRLVSFCVKILFYFNIRWIRISFNFVKLFTFLYSALEDEYSMLL